MELFDRLFVSYSMVEMLSYVVMCWKLCCMGSDLLCMV